MVMIIFNVNEIKTKGGFVRFVKMRGAEDGRRKGQTIARILSKLSTLIKVNKNINT